MPASLLRTALCALTVAAACGGATAATVTLDGWQFGGASFVGGDLDGRGFVANAGAVRGALGGAGDASTPGWRSYFAEIGEPYAFGMTIGGYSIVAGADYFGSAATADAIGRLLSYAADRPAAVDTAFEAAAMQIAIWNTAYDGDGLAGAGRFALDRRGQGQLITEANRLQQQAAGVSSRLDVYVLSQAGWRDLLLAVPQGTRVADAAVPEPGTAALGLLALGAVGAALRRRRAV